MDGKRMNFCDTLYRNAVADAAYCRLAEEHRVVNARLLRELEGMTDTQRNAVLDYLGLVAEIHNRLLVLSRNEAEIR